MPRRTRAAMRAEGIAVDSNATENLKPIDETAKKQLPPTPTQPERSPLAEVDTNSVGSGGVEETGTTGQGDEPEEKDMGSKRGRVAKKKAAKPKRGTKTDAKEEVQETGGVAIEQQDENVAHEVDSTLRNEDASEDAMTRENTVEEPVNQEEPSMFEAKHYNSQSLTALAGEPMQAGQPTSPELPSARLTRSQLARQEELAQHDAETTVFAPEPKMLKQDGMVPPPIQLQETLTAVNTPDPPQEETNEALTSDAPTQLDAQDSAPPETARNFDTDSIADASTVVADNSLKSSRRNTPARLSSLSPSRLSLRPDSIDAIDALEDALEQVGKSLQNFDVPLSPEKPSHDRIDDTHASRGMEKAAKWHMQQQMAMDERKMPFAGVVDVDRKALDSMKSARLRCNQEKKPRAAAANKATNTLARSASVRAAHSKSGSFTVTVAEKPSKPSVTSAKDDENKSADYLASRRRPISLQFPTPPPPTKSTKAPTRPTFQLPGEAVAAKLKAAREERLKREEEEAQKRKEFKARPMPNANPTMAVKQTAASKARQSLILHGEKTVAGAAAGNKENMSVKRASSVRESNVTKRLSTTLTGTAAKRASAVMAPSSSSTLSNPKPRVAASTTTSTDAAAKRSSIAANTSKPRNASIITPSISSNSTNSSSVPGAATAKATVTAADVVTQRAKAREIFNRDKVEKEMREKERREKEDAAKKARFQAAERGRQASREWAEKQKVKKEKERAAALEKLTGEGEGVDPERVTLAAL